jgi:RNA polymerase sigma-70 factor, ECF subfamily
MTERNPADAAELGLYLLVLRCQTGDERAFAQLMDRFAPRTLEYVRRLAGDAAEDVQQEVWIAVYRGIAGLANPRAFRTWLFRTTRHRVVDFLRKQNRERELIAVEPIEMVSDRAVVEQAPDMGESLISESMLEALESLPIAQREVLILRYQQEMTYAQIALVAGCAVGTVRSRLHHAKQRLYELLRGATQ